jgi:hypothetical protein
MAASGKADSSHHARAYRPGLLTSVEDVVYVALGVFLAGGTAVLLVSLAFSVWRNALGARWPGGSSTCSIRPS